jgi:hypothetical protein
MAAPPAVKDLEQEDLRASLKLDTLRLVMGGAAVPLPLIVFVNGEPVLRLLDLLGISLDAFMPYGLLATGAAASVLGWSMILPLLTRHDGWRAQLATLVAVLLSLQTALVITGLVTAVSGS